MDHKDDKRFYAGQRVRAIYWSEGEVIEAGKFDCLSIEVVMENGQMAGVPWFLVTYNSRSIFKPTKYNGALLEGVQLITITPPGEEG